MDGAEKLAKMIEVLRNEMILIAMDRGNLIDNKVLAVSQELDGLIVQYQKLHTIKNKAITNFKKTPA